MSPSVSMVFNILIKKEEKDYIAHCLELDIVCSSNNLDKTREEIIDLIKAQIDYAFSNENLEYLYRPAPASVWAEFYACKKQIESKVNIKSEFRETPKNFVPPSFIARTCTSSDNACYA